MEQSNLESNINERRLRPVYDALEVGNNKKALQEANKVLKKTPNIQCGRALKSLALLRLGREEESLEIIDSLNNEEPCEESTLQLMTFWYRETDQLDKISTLYANAVKKCPGNEDFLTHLFMSYVRINDFKTQQTVALQLFKAKPKNPYYIWAVMSVVLQAIAGPDSKNEQKTKMLLALAERMMDKLINEKRLDAEQEIQLYISILQYQRKFEETLTFLDSEVCQKYYAGIPVTVKMELLIKLDKWVELNKLMKELLTQESDRWDYYKIYLQSVFELIKRQDGTADVDNSIELCHEFLAQIIENDDNKKARGPYLARLELHRLMREHAFHGANDLLGDFLELLVEYFRLFGGKSCCTNDLKMFLEFLESERRSGLATRLLQDCGISATALPKSKEQMQKHICALQISRYCGAHLSLSEEHLTALYTALSLHYEHGMSAFGAGLLPTDMSLSYPYALLAVHVMYDISQKSKSSDRLVEALCLLNYVLSSTMHNFHAKLLLVQIYHLLGIGWGAQAVYESLDIKHIQLDSMGYLHCSQLPSFGMASLAKPLYDQTLKFFTTSYKDCVEYLAMSYKFGSFSKLEEFMEFRDKLSNSLHYSLTSVEALLLEMVYFSGSRAQNLASYKNMSINPAEDRIKWAELSDNRDLSVMIRWDPTFQAHPANGNSIGDSQQDVYKRMEADSFVQDTELLRVRSILLRLIAGSVDLLTTPNDADEQVSETFNQKRKIVADLLENWSVLFKRLRSSDDDTLQPTSREYLVNLLQSRLHVMLRLPYENVFTKLFTFIGRLCDGDHKAKAVGEALSDDLAELNAMFAARIEEHNKEQDLLWKRKYVQETLVAIIEILSLCTFVLSVCCKQLNQPTQPKKQKHKPATPAAVAPTADSVVLTEKEKIAIVSETAAKLKPMFGDIEKRLGQWRTPFLCDSLSKCLEALSIDDKAEKLVNTTIRESHNLFVQEMQNLVKEKARMLAP